MALNDKHLDQLIVRVGKSCNFRCNFCNVADNEVHVKPKENMKDIVRNFHYKLKYSNIRSKRIIITLSGGEPSIFQKETIFAIRYIDWYLKKNGIEPIFEIQTNASCIDQRFAKQLKICGVQKALVSFHMIDPVIFTEVIQVPYTQFSRIIEGIHHLHEAGIIVDTNTIISRQNAKNFFDTIVFLETNFPFIDIFNIGAIQPHGEAQKVLDTVIPFYDEVADVYNTSIAYLKEKNRNITSHYTGLPPCFLDDHDVSLEMTDNIAFRKDFNFSEKYLINHLNDSNKVQTSDCHECLYNQVCSGIWKEYAGIQRLAPKPYIRDVRSAKPEAWWHLLTSPDESLQDLSTRWVHQIIIPTSLAERSGIYSILQAANTIGFYKITLLINTEFPLDSSLLMTGVTNIQWENQYFSDHFIAELTSFSQRYAPQFRVEIDRY